MKDEIRFNLIDKSYIHLYRKIRNSEHSLHFVFIQIYEGYYHELDKEPEGEREIVTKDLEDWTRNLLEKIESKGKGQVSVNGETKHDAVSPSNVELETP